MCKKNFLFFVKKVKKTFLLFNIFYFQGEFRQHVEKIIYKNAILIIFKQKAGPFYKQKYL